MCDYSEAFKIKMASAMIEIDCEKLNEMAIHIVDDEPEKEPKMNEMAIHIADSESDTESHEVQVLPKKMRQRRSWVAGCQLGVSPREYRRLKRMHAPRLLLFLMRALMLCHGCIPHDLSVAEMFSGIGHLVSFARASGLGALGFEILEDKVHQDFCGTLGFLQALLMMLRLEVQALVHWDTCCSNWVWMSRSGTGRHSVNPMGDPSNQKVQIANLMVSRMCCLQLVAFAKYAIMLLEQPGSSMMPQHRRMQEPQFRNLFRIFVHMGAYNAKSAKPSILLSNELLVTLPLKRPMTPAQKAQCDGSHLVKKTYKPDGTLVITGVKGANGLKSSQEYTPEYAAAVLKSYRNWKERHAPEVTLLESSESDYSEEADDSWDDALLQPCAALFADLDATRSF